MCLSDMRFINLAGWLDAHQAGRCICRIVAQNATCQMSILTCMTPKLVLSQNTQTNLVALSLTFDLFLQYQFPRKPATSITTSLQMSSNIPPHRWMRSWFRRCTGSSCRRCRELPFRFCILGGGVLVGGTGDSPNSHRTQRTLCPLNSPHFYLPHKPVDSLSYPEGKTRNPAPPQMFK